MWKPAAFLDSIACSQDRLRKWKIMEYRSTRQTWILKENWLNLTLYDYINMPKNDTKSIKRIKASYKVRNLYMWHLIIGSNLLYVFDTGQYENLFFIYLFIKIMKLILWYNKPPVTSQLDQFWFAPCYDNAKGWLDLMINRADNPWYPPTGLPNQVLISFH